MQHLSEQRCDEVRPAIEAWPRYRTNCTPARSRRPGEEPDGRSWTGLLGGDIARPLRIDSPSPCPARSASAGSG